MLEVTDRAAESLRKFLAGKGGEARTVRIYIQGHG